MSNLVTLLSNAIIPSVFLPYMQERTAQLSAFRASGVVVRDSQIDELASGKGKIFDLPFWQDISGPLQTESQILSDSVPLETKRITALEQMAIAHGRGEGFAANSLVRYLTAEDPMKAIAERIANYWAIDEQDMLIATADGIFADNVANDSSDLVNNIASETTGGQSAATKFSTTAFIDAKAKLGDAGSKLGAMAVHSKVYYDIERADLIDFIPDSEGKSSIPTYRGMRLIVDDRLSRAGTTSGTVYKTFIFAGGAFQMGEAALGSVPIEGGFGTEALELARDAAAGVNKLYTRRRFILHPHGWKWLSVALVGQSPTNAELATATNYDRVFEKKNCRIVEFLTN